MGSGAKRTTKAALGPTLLTTPSAGGERKTFKDRLLRGHPEPDVDLTYIKQTGESNGPQGDPYNGLDQFGRVADQRWRQGDGTHPDRFGYGYDRNSNRLYRENLLGGAAAAFSELYHARGSSGTYDDLDQVKEFVRGTLNGAKDDVTEATPARRQRWTSLDIMGNWTTFDQWVGSTQTTQTRTHNKQNQLTAINSTTLTYNAVGNLTQDEAGRALTYDAWNRLVTVGTLTYTYDALSRRIKETTSSPSLTKDLYYSSAWQVLEERHDGAVKVQYVWSPVYVDALVLRDRDVNGLTGDGLEERLYVQQDAHWNVTAVVSAAGAVQERYVYDPYGVPTRLSAGWTTPGPDTLVWQYLHQGGLYEALVGLYHFRMRDYSPTLGRWITVDPIGFAAGDGNFYRYVTNSPTGFVDYSGLAAETIPPSQWPHWVRPLIGVAGGAGERGTIMEVIEVVNNMQHQGGGHFDIWYKDECGNARKQRFHRGGIPFTEAENDALANQNRGKGGRGRGKKGRGGRGGQLRAQALVSMLGVTAIYLGVAYAHGEIIDLGWNRGLDLSTKVGLGRALQLADGMNALPGPQFVVQAGGRNIHVGVHEHRPNEYYLIAWYTQSHWFPFIGTYEEVVPLISVSDNYRVYNVDFDEPPSPLRPGSGILRTTISIASAPI